MALQRFPPNQVRKQLRRQFNTVRRCFSGGSFEILIALLHMSIYIELSRQPETQTDVRGVRYESWFRISTTLIWKKEHLEKRYDFSYNTNRMLLLLLNTSIANKYLSVLYIHLKQ